MDTFTLSNGVEMPTLAFGPGSFVGWEPCQPFHHIPFSRRLNRLALRLRDRWRRRRGLHLLTQAIRSGVRLIDYSHTYMDEWILAAAVRKSGLKREEIFITSRAGNEDLYKDRVYDTCRRTIESMGLSHLDMYMFHWPVPEHFLKAYQDLERLYKEGFIRAIGVCNCHIHHLKAIMDICTITPMVNQFEVHPLFTQEPLVQFCRDNHILVEAYTALARNDDRLRNERILNQLSQKYGKTHAQIILRWHIQRELIPIFRSSSLKRIKSNLNIFDFSLTRDELESISGLNLDSRLRYDPDRSDLTRL